MAPQLPRQYFTSAESRRGREASLTQDEEKRQRSLAQRRGRGPGEQPAAFPRPGPAIKETNTPTLYRPTRYLRGAWRLRLSPRSLSTAHPYKTLTVSPPPAPQPGDAILSTCPPPRLPDYTLTSRCKVTCPHQPNQAIR